MQFDNAANLDRKSGVPGMKKTGEALQSLWLGRSITTTKTEKGRDPIGLPPFRFPRPLRS
jgi:hypothetical protein